MLQLCFLMLPYRIKQELRFTIAVCNKCCCCCFVMEIALTIKLGFLRQNIQIMKHYRTRYEDWHNLLSVLFKQTINYRCKLHRLISYPIKHITRQFLQYDKEVLPRQKHLFPSGSSKFPKIISSKNVPLLCNGINYLLYLFFKKVSDFPTIKRLL